MHGQVIDTFIRFRYLVLLLALVRQLGSAPVAIQPTVLSSDARKMVVEIRVADFSLKAIERGHARSVLFIDGYASTAKPGYPQLPVMGFALAVPPTSAPRIEILEHRITEHHVPHLCPAPHVYGDFQGPQPHASLQTHLVYEANSEVYNTDAFYPHAPVVLGAHGIMRGIHIQTVQLYPVLYNPVKNRIQSFSYVKLAIYFDSSNARHTVSSQDIKSPFDKIFQTQLINFEQAKAWKSKSLHLKKQADDVPGAGKKWLKINVKEPGIYSITYNDLSRCGFDKQDWDPRNLQLFNMGKEVAIRVLGEEDGHFDKNDKIEFYAKAFKNYFTDSNVYWLTVAEIPGKRMQHVDGSVDSTGKTATTSRFRVHVEKDSLRSAEFPGHTDQERWFMDSLKWIGGSAEVTQNYTVALPDVAKQRSTPAKLVVRVQGITSNPVTPDHHTRVYINGTMVLDKKWEGRVAFLDSSLFDVSLLRSGQNTLTIALPGETAAFFDFQMTDYFEVEYTRELAMHDGELLATVEPDLQMVRFTQIESDSVDVFHISHPHNVQLIKNTTRVADTLLFLHQTQQKSFYLAVAESAKKSPKMTLYETSGLRETTLTADYLFIVPYEFSHLVSSLEQWRQNQGFTTRVIHVEDIYNEFGFGIPSERAIKLFLQYAYFEWQKPPTFVLLVGDASWNPRQLNSGNAYYAGDRQTDFIPTRLFESRIDHFEAASDNWFVCVDGEEDVLPDMLIGRLPANTAHQVEDMVTKIINYEAKRDSALQNIATFVADNGQGGLLAFEDTSDALIGKFVPPDILAEKLYLSQLGMPETKHQVMQAFSRGSLLVSYFGHGSVKSWSASTVFSRDDVPFLQPTHSLPFVFTMSCINGYFVEPAEQNSALAEALLRAPETGAIAMFSASGEALPSPIFALANQFYSSLFEHGLLSCGGLAATSVFSMFKHFPLYDDHIRFYILFGDPATELFYEPTESIASAGFAGTIHLGSQKAEPGIPILAFINQQVVAADNVLSEQGEFGPLFIKMDNPATAKKEGGVPGDTVCFAILADSDTVKLYPPALFLENNVQHLLLCDVPTHVETDVQVQYAVDSQIVGVDVFDGDPIAKYSTIRILLTSENPLHPENVVLTLDERALPPHEYRCEHSSPSQLDIYYLPDGLGDGLHKLAILPPSAENYSTTSFVFLIQSTLGLAEVMNFPNPFSEHTEFTFQMNNDRPAPVTIKIYAISGRLIHTIDKFAKVGYNSIDWDGLDAAGARLANGVYLYRISANDGEEHAEVLERLVVMR